MVTKTRRQRDKAKKALADASRQTKEDRFSLARATGLVKRSLRMEKNNNR